MDRRCLPALAELDEAFPGQLRVIEGDAMKVPHGIEEPFHIVANLPYNVGTPLFTGWLGGEAWPPRWTSLTLMFQLEVAERIVAPPGSGAYGRLAVLAQWRSAAKLAKAAATACWMSRAAAASTSQRAGAVGVQ